MAPIELGEFPAFASLATRASTSSGVYLNHDGGFLLTGRVDPDRPRLLVYNLAKFDTLRACSNLGFRYSTTSAVFKSFPQAAETKLHQGTLTGKNYCKSACAASSHFENFPNAAAL